MRSVLSNMLLRLWRWSVPSPGAPTTRVYGRTRVDTYPNGTTEYIIGVSSGTTPSVGHFAARITETGST